MSETQTQNQSKWSNRKRQVVETSLLKPQQDVPVQFEVVEVIPVMLQGKQAKALKVKLEDGTEKRINMTAELRLKFEEFGETLDGRVFELTLKGMQTVEVRKDEYVDVNTYDIHELLPE